MKVRDLKRIALALLISPFAGIALGYVITWATSDYFPALTPQSIEEVDPSISAHIGHKPIGLVYETEEDTVYITVTTDEVIGYLNDEPIYKTIIKEDNTDD